MTSHALIQRVLLVVVLRGKCMVRGSIPAMGFNAPAPVGSESDRPRSVRSAALPRAYGTNSAMVSQRSDSLIQPSQHTRRHLHLRTMTLALGDLALSHDDDHTAPTCTKSRNDGKPQNSAYTPARRSQSNERPRPAAAATRPASGQQHTQGDAPRHPLTRTSGP